MKRILFLLLMLSAFTTALHAQMLQVIHNVADPAADTVDVWVNGEKALPDFVFQTATPFIDFSGTTDFKVEIKPKGSEMATPALIAKNFDGVMPDAVLHLIAGGDIKVGLDIFAVPATRTAEAGEVVITAFHGVTDAPVVNLVADKSIGLFGPLSFGENSDATTVNVGDYELTLTLNDGMTAAEHTRILSYDFPADTFAGKGIIVLAAGYMDPMAAGSTTFLRMIYVTPEGESGFLFRRNATLQGIHNSADPALADIKVNFNYTNWPNRMILPQALPLKFRQATPQLNLPADAPLQMLVYNTSDALLATVPMDEFQNDVMHNLLVSGVLNATGFAVNPDGVGLGLRLNVFSPQRMEAQTATNADILIFHGSTDAPAVDLKARGVIDLATNIKYGEYNDAGYVSVPAADYTLDVHVAGETDPLLTYTLPASLLATRSAVAFASGFLTPAQNKGGPAFGIFVALLNGQVLELEPTSRAKGYANLEGFNSWPNPAQDSWNVSWTQSQFGNATLEVYDITGRQVMNRSFENVAPGAAQQNVSLSTMPQGIYSYRLVSGNQAAVGKVHVTR